VVVAPRGGNRNRDTNPKSLKQFARRFAIAVRNGTGLEDAPGEEPCVLHTLDPHHIYDQTGS
jgi:hypothetical protein